ncbi:hypothetical protein LNTAR_13192 [Lentisphaera araneosa HTCC2155]|uniref:HPr kinase/phosphorylase C-terminal domain-containing protein n=1 Tax=Lentisphaera araneosa HTCC2155 TaxID=313628 RepID=A6DRN7_9BACT|nr:hypothetical protein [Lentisphaera araneosa]EDM25706.1 hypothetical protein LNTAR_13192 [Lentisphaera araneosa HTCC2155]
MFKYFAYGLKVTSEIELDELIVRDFKGEADIEIVFGETPDQINGPDWYGDWWQANDYCLLCDFTDVIRALVSRNGKEVTLQVFTEDDFQLRSFIYGQVLSACLLLRGYFLLHGACVKIGDRAVGFCGSSGVGKSTLTLAFMEEGYTVYSDDVIALKVEGDKLMMHPGFPRLRVTKETMTRMSVRAADFENIDHFPTKLNYVKGFSFCSDEIELDELLILNPTDCTKPNIRNVSGWEKLNLFEEGHYRKSIEKLIYSEKDMLKRRTKIANIAKCHYLDRPNTYYCLMQMIDYINLKFHL